MKRTLTLLVALVFVLSLLLTGCSQIENLLKGVEAYSLVKGAVEKTNGLDSVEMKITEKLKMDLGGMTLNVPVVMEVKTSGLKGDSPIGSAKVSTKTILGSTEQSLYFDKDYVYVAQEDAKYKVGRDSDEAAAYETMDFSNLVKELPEDVLKDVQVEKTEDGSHSVSVDISKEVFHRMFEDLSKQLTSSAAGDLALMPDSDVKLDISDPHVDILVRQDGYVGSYGLSFKMTVEMNAEDAQSEESEEPEDSTMNYDIAITAEFIDPGKEVTVTLPDDLEEYQDYEDYMGGDWNWDDDDDDWNWDDDVDDGDDEWDWDDDNGDGDDDWDWDDDDDGDDWDWDDDNDDGDDDTDYENGENETPILN